MYNIYNFKRIYEKRENNIMALPKFFEFFRPFLEAVSDGELHTPNDVREFIRHILIKLDLSKHL